jgi:uncharacterized protein YqeY
VARERHLAVLLCGMEAPPNAGPAYATAFREAGRVELAEGEEAEAAVIEAYLPSELGDDELRAIVATAIAESGASSPKDLGGVMKLAMERTGGRADGKRVSSLARVTRPVGGRPFALRVVV